MRKIKGYETTEIVARVYINKSNGQKLVTIPQKSSIKEGDYVKIEKV